MRTYIVGMASWYRQAWHIDYSTVCEPTTEENAIKRGHELASMGAFPLYVEYQDGVRTHYMIEFNGHLEIAAGECY